MRFLEGTKLDFSDVLLVPQRSIITSRKEVDLVRKFTFKHHLASIIWEGIPIISANMTSVTNEKVARVMHENKMLACLPKNMNLKKACELMQQYPGTIASMGIEFVDFKLPSFRPYIICADVANGYMEKFVDLIAQLREQYNQMIIIAGNVVTPEMTEALILAGADIVKVGIGSGAACATRLKTGVGYPQLSAVIECADAAHGLGGHIVSDGGCTCPGDVVKAFAAGADFVMLGSMLAGHTENGTEFYGESSKKANEQNAGGLHEYRTSEGWETQLPEKGNLKNTLQDILGGLRSACSYVGASKLKDLPKRARFIHVNNQLNTSILEYRRE